MCVPNTPAHCVLKVMNWDGDAVVLFLNLKIKFTVIKIHVLQILVFCAPRHSQSKELSLPKQHEPVGICDGESVCC